ncbi:MAG: aminotransferase class III-fold pyridoxal phosphate-dependent enzyme [Patescibacteria group bacterium]
MKNSGQKLWKRAKKIIPGGGQLLSKRAEMFAPGVWPAYYSRAKGATIWDLDGKKYTDFSLMGVGANMLGYANPDVDNAVIAAIKHGSMSTLNTPKEVELAELLLRLHPWADMVRYARTGGESMAIAARIARAYSGRDTIAFCGYHGWADWYLATNLQKKDALAAHLLKGLEPKGVPRGLRGSIVPFRYNHIEELEQIIKKHGKLAAVIMEPVHGEEPQKGFLKKVRALANKAGAVLVFDEITMGFRLTLGGAHLTYGVMPDMAIFAKGMSNGYPMAAIIGKKNVMQAAQGTFISSTYWTEAVGPAAALATIRTMKKKKVQTRLAALGRRVRVVWQKAALKHGLVINCSGVAPMQFFSFSGPDAQIIKTVFVTEMLKRGFLASNLYYASFAHTDADVARYERALNEVFALIVKAQKMGHLKKLLKGPVAHTGFERLN